MSPTPEIIAHVRSTLPKLLVSFNNIRHRTPFPMIMFTKKSHASVDVNSLFTQNFMTARCLKCSVSARDLIIFAASHVELESHCERMAFLTTSVFCMYAEKTLK